MIYHLYDDKGQHLAMSESFGDLRYAALQAIQQEGFPHVVIRWTDTNGEPRELRVTLSNRPTAAQAMRPGHPQVHQTNAARQQPSASQRANVLVGTVVVVVMLYVASEIASMVVDKPLTQAVFGF